MSTTITVVPPSTASPKSSSSARSFQGPQVHSRDFAYPQTPSTRSAPDMMNVNTMNAGQTPYPSQIPSLPASTSSVGMGMGATNLYAGTGYPSAGVAGTAASIPAPMPAGTLGTGGMPGVGTGAYGYGTAGVAGPGIAYAGVPGYLRNGYGTAPVAGGVGYPGAAAYGGVGQGSVPGPMPLGKPAMGMQSSPNTIVLPSRSRSLSTSSTSTTTTTTTSSSSYDSDSSYEHRHSRTSRRRERELMRAEFEREMRQREMDMEDNADASRGLRTGPIPEPTVPSQVSSRTRTKNHARPRHKPRSQSKERYYSPPPPSPLPSPEPSRASGIPAPAAYTSTPIAREISPSQGQIQEDRRLRARALSQPARAVHISESPYGADDLTRDNGSIRLPNDYVPVGGYEGAAKSRPPGYGGPAEGQPGPINPNVHEQPYPTSQAQGSNYNSQPSQYTAQHQYPTTIHPHHYPKPEVRIEQQGGPTVIQGLEKLGEAIVDQYVQKHQASSGSGSGSGRSHRSRDHSSSGHRHRASERERDVDRGYHDRGRERDTESERDRERTRDRDRDHRHHSSSRHRDSSSRHSGHSKHQHRSSSTSDAVRVIQVPNPTSTTYPYAAEGVVAGQTPAVATSAPVKATRVTASRPAYSRRRSKSVDDRYLGSRESGQERALRYAAKYGGYGSSGAATTGYRTGSSGYGTGFGYGGAYGMGGYGSYAQATSPLQQVYTAGNGPSYGYGAGLRPVSATPMQPQPVAQQPIIQQPIASAGMPASAGNMPQFIRTPPPPATSLAAASSGMPYAPYDPRQPLPPPRPANNTHGQPPPHPIPGQPHSFFSKLLGIGGAGNGGGGIRASRTRRRDPLDGEVDDEPVAVDQAARGVGAPGAMGSGYGHRYGRSRGGSF